MRQLGAWSVEHGAKRGFGTRRVAGAFTLIELLVVVAVIAILAGITLAAMGGAQQRAARNRTQAEISAIANALEAYRSQHGQYPAASSGNKIPYTNIVGYLGTDRVTVEGGQVIDPFGADYTYLWPGTRNRASFDLYSTAGAGANETNKHIGNW
jgi:type II secretion system protein G